jgi:hypothetical protein
MMKMRFSALAERPPQSVAAKATAATVQRMQHSLGRGRDREGERMRGKL